MPTLDAFDQEFAPEQEDPVRDPRHTGFRLSTWLVLALVAGVISALALGWPNTAGLWPSQQSETVLGQAEKPEAVVHRLSHEVETLKQEISELTRAQQQANETIAALQAAEQVHRGASWYSNLAALTFGIPTQSETSAQSDRRSATIRPRPRERDDGAPLSLEAPPQQ